MKIIVDKLPEYAADCPAFDVDTGACRLSGDICWSPDECDQLLPFDEYLAQRKEVKA